MLNCELDVQVIKTIVSEGMSEIIVRVKRKSVVTRVMNFYKI